MVKPVQPVKVKLFRACRARGGRTAKGRLDPSLPYLKRQAVELLLKPYANRDEALRSIADGLEGFYRANYPDVHASKSDAIRAAVAEVQRVYRTYFFPEMKTDWRAHPDNIGHFYAQGCFRCHDGQHKSDTGKVIRSECNICHTTLDQSEGGRAVPVGDGLFRHPVNLGTLWDVKCVDCHKHNKPFQHPVNLGDISQFQCAECHKPTPARR